MIEESHGGQEATLGRTERIAEVHAPLNGAWTFI